ncbi:MAG: hypothetical protein J6V21_00125 [Alistipes sp.]|nr:hypothetical protein [Alistipes sp.]
MKNLKLLVVALVAMLGFAACDNKPEYIYDDHSADLVGTWTCITENYAEALIINADGTAVSYGVEDGEYWENVKGTVTVKENNITMIFEDDDNWTGHFDVIPGMAFSLFEENGERYVYQYCANDLSDEIVGMWVCTDAPTENAESTIVHTFMDNGKAIYTGYGTRVDDYLVNEETTYEVIGDLLFYALPKDELAEGERPYIIKKLTYKPNGTVYGDIMEEKTMKSTSTMLRIKQSLNLTGRQYDYISAYVTNANGKDEDFSILGNTFNISKIESSDLDRMFRSILSCIELNENTIKFTFNNNGRESVYNDPITADGNKVTVDMSTENPACRKVEMYMFQDANDTQLHIYMPTKSFINYFANLQIPTLKAEGKLDTNDAAAVEKVFADMEARIESINVSLVLKARK